MEIKKRQLSKKLNDWIRVVLVSALLISVACSVDEKITTIDIEGEHVNNLSEYSEELTVISVFAEVEQEGNPGLNVIDSDLNSRWSGYGNPVALVLDLGEVKTVDYVKVAFYNGDERTNSFNVYTSNDNSTWNLINSKTSSGETEELQDFDLENTDAQFLKFEFLGNSINEWNSILEIVVLGVNNNTTSNYTTIPAIIQAEDYASKSNTPATEPSRDIDEGVSVGWISNVNDYLSYNVNVPNSGEYNVDFRLASKTNGANFDIYQGNNVVGSVSIPATGDWYNWETVSTTINLSAGEQIIKLVATGTGWNINWFEFTEIEENPDAVNLSLRVHIMQDSWTHPSGVELTSWVTPDDVTQVIMPELNQIWSSNTNIVWNLESIIEEPIYEYDGYEDAIDFIVNADRDDSSSTRFSTILSLIQPENHIDSDEFGNYLYHIYLFPFTGNTLQGTAYYYDNYAVTTMWSNKHNGGGNPEKTLLTEDHDNFVRGSLSRTIGHELGHNLRFTHDDCDPCLMKNGGYSITDEQAVSAEEAAEENQNIYCSGCNLF